MSDRQERIAKLRKELQELEAQERLPLMVACVHNVKKALTVAPGMNLHDRLWVRVHMATPSMAQNLYLTRADVQKLADLLQELLK